MNKKSLFILGFVLVGLLFVTGVGLPEVGAVSYYNWLLAPSFEENTNLIEDSSFESGSLNSGVEFGNWTVASSCTYDTSLFHNGVTALKCGSEVGYIWYNFSSSYQHLGADFDSAGMWMYKLSGDDTLDIVFVYDDETSDRIDDIVYQAEAEFWYLDITDNVTDTINPVKVLVAIKIEFDDTATWMDDVVWYAEGYGDDGQDSDISIFSDPWFGGNNNDHLLVISADSYTGDRCVSIGFEESTDKLCQNLEYLDSDTVPYVTCYAKFNVDVALTCRLIYSDGSSSSKSVNGSDIGSWELVTFSGSFISANKYIVSIQFQLFNYVSSTVLIDDVYLPSTLAINQQRFDWSIVPAPVQELGWSSVALYKGVTYRFHGEVFDTNGDKVENGTFMVSHNTGSITGNITNGDFYFTFPVRSGVTNSSEMFGMYVVLDDEVLQQSITVYWWYIEGISDGSGDSDDSGGFLFADSDFQWLLLSMFVMFTPAMMFSALLAKEAPVQGFFAGLIIGSGIMLMTGYGTFYFVLLSALAVAMLFLTMLNRS